jgi:hypothetical protein
MSLANGECGLTCPTPWRIFPDLGWPCLQSESSCYQFVCFAAYFRTDFPLDQAIDVLAVNILVIRVEAERERTELYGKVGGLQYTDSCLMNFDS